ncbi:hypothetical protein GCM10009796_19620 [Microbacterium koreense]
MPIGLSVRTGEPDATVGEGAASSSALALAAGAVTVSAHTPTAATTAARRRGGRRFRREGTVIVVGIRSCAMSGPHDQVRFYGPTPERPMLGAAVVGYSRG